MAATLSASCAAFGQTFDDRTVSEHVRIRIPIERQWLAGEIIRDLERCWVFVYGATKDNLPPRILVDFDWNEAQTRVDFAQGRILVGMNHPDAASDSKRFMLHTATREMARMGLLWLSRGAGAREEAGFLVDGMAEILAREYASSTRKLKAAWMLAQLLDRMNLLGLAVQSSWSSFSGGQHDLRTAAPGVTFILTCRDLYGRDKVLKLFEGLPRGGLEKSLESTFRTPAAVLEQAWRERVRAYKQPDTAPNALEEVPLQLEQAVHIPTVGRPGTTLQIQLFIRKGQEPVLPNWLYVVEDGAAGRIFQARPSADKSAKYALVELPIEPDKQPGTYGYRVIAVDGNGDLGDWQASYSIGP